MKTILNLAYLAIVFTALVITSCGPSPAEWDDTPNPLDTPGADDDRTNWRPEAAGRFGPGGPTPFDHH